MNIAGIEFNINTKSYEIYVAGCDGSCEGCHNVSLWDFNVGKPWFSWKDKIIQNINTDIVENVWVLGGEPILQNLNELEMMLWWLRCITCKPIWLFTRFELNDIPNSIKQYLTYVKTGRYMEDLPPITDEETGITLASNNQKIYKLK